MVGRVVRKYRVRMRMMIVFEMLVVIEVLIVRVLFLIVVRLLKLERNFCILLMRFWN